MATPSSSSHFWLLVDCWRWDTRLMNLLVFFLLLVQSNLNWSYCLSCSLSLVFQARQKKVLLWFFVTLLLLVLSAMLLIPDWLVQNFMEILRYPGYNPAINLQSALVEVLPGFGARLGWAISGVLALLLLIEWGIAARSNFRGLLWAAMITLLATQWIGIPTDPGNFIILFPAIVLIFESWERRWRNAGKFFVILCLILCLSLFGSFSSKHCSPAINLNKARSCFFPFSCFSVDHALLVTLVDLKKPGKIGFLNCWKKTPIRFYEEEISNIFSDFVFRIGVALFVHHRSRDHLWRCVQHASCPAGSDEYCQRNGCRYHAAVILFHLAFLDGVIRWIWWCRVLSILFSLGGMIFIFLLVNELAGFEAAAWTTVFAAFSHFKYTMHKTSVCMHFYSSRKWHICIVLSWFYKRKRTHLFSMGSIHPFWRFIAVYSQFGDFLFSDTQFIPLAAKEVAFFAKLLCSQLVMGILFIPWLFNIPGQIEKIQTAFWTPQPKPWKLYRGLFIHRFSDTGNLLVGCCCHIEFVFIFSVPVLFTAPTNNFFRNEAIFSDIDFRVAAHFIYPVLLMRPIFVPRAFLVSSLFYYAALAFVAVKMQYKISKYAFLAVPIVISLISLPNLYKIWFVPALTLFRCLNGCWGKQCGEWNYPSW